MVTRPGDAEGKVKYIGFSFERLIKWQVDQTTWRHFSVSYFKFFSSSAASILANAFQHNLILNTSGKPETHTKKWQPCCHAARLQLTIHAAHALVFLTSKHHLFGK